MKQTAVEWLIEELRGAHVKGDFIFNGVITSELIEQAKAMEKEQIINAWDDGAYGCGQFTTTHDNSEQYYNETFKSE